MKKLDLTKFTDGKLIEFAQGHANQYIGDAVAPEFIRRLKTSIKEFSKKSSEQTKKMIYLTKWIIGLTIVLSVITIFEIIYFIIEK